MGRRREMRLGEWWGFFGFPCSATSETLSLPTLCAKLHVIAWGSCPSQAVLLTLFSAQVVGVSVCAAWVVWEHGLFGPDVEVAEGELGLCPGVSMCWRFHLLGSFQREKEEPSLLNCDPRPAAPASAPERTSKWLSTLAVEKCSPNPCGRLFGGNHGIV